MLILKSLEELDQIASDFVEELQNLMGRTIFGNTCCIAFYGEMGVGKTTLIKAICKVLGVREIVSSPTFAIINEYHTPEDNIIYHFDFYRIKGVSEAFDLGYEDYFYSNHLCMIEWPEKIEQILPDNTVKVVLTELKDGSRKVTLNL